MVIPSLNLPRLDLPNAPEMPVPTLELPSAEIPRYTPLVVPPSDLRAPPGVKGTTPSDKPPAKTTKPPASNEVRMIDVPYIDQQIPVPSAPIVITAGSTAVVSVGAGMIATAVFKRLVSIFKPIIKKLLTKKDGRKTSKLDD
jgi:hypothetical protein